MATRSTGPKLAAVHLIPTKQAWHAKVIETAIDSSPRDLTTLLATLAAAVSPVTSQQRRGRTTRCSVFTEKLTRPEPAARLHILLPMGTEWARWVPARHRHPALTRRGLAPLRRGARQTVPNGRAEDKGRFEIYKAGPEDSRAWS